MKHETFILNDDKRGIIFFVQNSTFYERSPVIMAYVADGNKRSLETLYSSADFLRSVQHTFTTLKYFNDMGS